MRGAGADRAAPLRPGSPEEVGMLPERLELARRLLASHAREGRTPAIVALVARRGVIVLDEAHGELRPGGPALPRDAIFPITSMTKPLTATLAMLLIEEGRLSIGRPAREYLPELEGDGIDDVLVHHLLTHTSGWDDNAVFENMLKKVAAGAAPELPPDAHPLHHGALLAGLDTPRKLPPGDTMIYCNFNYTLLGEIVERVSGRPFAEFARERLFGPLGMQDTDYVLREDMRERLLVRPPGAPMKDELMGLPGSETVAWERMPNGAGGAYSTARDIAVFGQMFLNGGRYGDRRILSPPAVAAMTRNQIPGIGAVFMDFPVPEGGYGYGWMVRTWYVWKLLNGLTSLGSYSHTGAGGNAFWIDPANETIQVVLEVCMDLSPDLEPRSWLFDRFQSVVASAIDD
jgi:CubicO group peptidase (beta-lactamase class C family)